MPLEFVNSESAKLKVESNCEHIEGYWSTWEERQNQSYPLPETKYYKKICYFQNRSSKKKNWILKKKIVSRKQSFLPVLVMFKGVLSRDMGKKG